jgi:hypothetical protein
MSRLRNAIALGATAGLLACEPADMGGNSRAPGGPSDSEWAGEHDSGGQVSGPVPRVHDDGDITTDPDGTRTHDDGGGDVADLPPCEGTEVRLPTSTIFAVAPLGVADEHLGRPVNENFEFIGGRDGASILPGASVYDNQVDAVEHSYIYIEDSRSLSANASYFTISGSVADQRTRRHAIFSAYDIATVREIDDTAEQRDAPADAAFFLWRIYYGHSYQALVSGEQTAFHAGVRARFGVASGGIETFASQNNLTVQASGRGLEPRDGDALFAHTQDDIEQNYTADGDPVPIFVEYRSIPTACVSDPETFEWLDPTIVEVAYDQLYVYNDGSWGADTWSLDANCSIDGRDSWLENPVVWDQHQDVCDDAVAGIPGPAGDGDYCQYNLGWRTRLEAVEGDVIRCGIQGMAWDGNNPVEYSEFTYTVGADHTLVSDKIGAGNGDTEYWLFYSLNFPDEN